MIRNTKRPMPNPGSTEAVKAGCICAVLDNEHGRGYMGMPNVFVYTCGCPVHSKTKKIRRKAAR